MAGTLNEKDLEHLDKQTLITLLISTNASNAALLKQVEQLNDSRQAPEQAGELPEGSPFRTFI